MNDPDAVQPAEPVTRYERVLAHDPVVGWAHGARHHLVVRILDRLARSLPDRPLRVTDLGCAHARLFEVLDARMKVEYVGVEPWDEVARAAAARHGERPNFRLVRGDATDRLVLEEACEGADAVVALETLEHVPEPDVVRLIEHLAEIRPSLLACSVPVEVGPAIWAKNLASLALRYVRHREYTWSQTFWAGLGRLEKLPAHGTGHLGFDWRWLAATIHQHFQVVHVHSMPLSVLPTWLSTSVLLEARPRDP